jgi:hypothetical protein
MALYLSSPYISTTPCLIMHGDDATPQRLPCVTHHSETVTFEYLYLWGVTLCRWINPSCTAPACSWLLDPEDKGNMFILGKGSTQPATEPLFILSSSSYTKCNTHTNKPEGNTALINILCGGIWSFNMLAHDTSLSGNIPTVARLAGFCGWQSAQKQMLLPKVRLSPADLSFTLHAICTHHEEQVQQKVVTHSVPLHFRR